MNRHQIEALPAVLEATQVLQGLENRGLVEPAIAAGWTRAMLTDTTSNDIDVSFVGPMHYEDAQIQLASVLEQLRFDPEPWDIEGIWNAQIAYGVKHTVDNFLLYYVDSIDSVYLASDGMLHDSTGRGFDDAETRTLRINGYDREDDRIPTDCDEVNICLEGCRRITQLGWTPTSESSERIINGHENWNRLTGDEKAYFHHKLARKFKINERSDAEVSYDTFGWGFIFKDLLV